MGLEALESVKYGLTTTVLFVWDYNVVKSRLGSVISGLFVYLTRDLHFFCEGTHNNTVRWT